MRLALIGYGSVGKAFARLLLTKHSVFPFRIIGIHTRHGTAYDPKGLAVEPAFGTPCDSVGTFLDEAEPDVAIEITTLNPQSGEPAISHIREAFSRNIHVITANKGPIAFAYSDLCAEAKRVQVQFRFESTVMDGAPVFNTVRNNLPGIQILGFSGVLNSTSKIVVEAMERGESMQEGIQEAKAKGVAEADASYDLEGWDSAAKTAALANVFMDARTNPRAVARTGLSDLTTERVQQLRSRAKTVMLVSRAFRTPGRELLLQVAPEVLARTDLLATARGTSNILLLHTDLMGTLGMISVEPGVEQTAYGLFSDLVDIAKSV